MNSSNSTKVLEQIFSDFSNQKGLLDLKQTLQLINQNDVKDAELFKIKLTQALKDRRSVMDRDQFVKYFSRCDDEEHLSAVFDLIDNDKSQNISKQELAAMNVKYGIGLSQAQIKAMINQISSDGQKVSKAELIKFLTMK